MVKAWACLCTLLMISGGAVIHPSLRPGPTDLAKVSTLITRLAESIERYEGGSGWRESKANALAVAKDYFITGRVQLEFAKFYLK